MQVMKLKKFALLFLFPLVISSCSINDFYNTLKEIEIFDYKNAYYQGYSFAETNRLEIYGTYSNGDVKKLTLSDVSSYLSINEQTEDINTPFDNSGTYSFYVSKSGVSSNVISLDVNSEIVYASSVSISSDKGPTIKTLEDVNFEVEILPSNYNVDFEVSFSRETIKFTQNNVHDFTFYDERVGVNTLTVQVHSDESTYIHDEIEFTVEASAEIVNMNQLYKNYHGYNSPSKGNVKYLVIPVWFTDSSTYLPISNRENVREDIYSVYFGESSDTGWESVSSYYKKESNELFNLSGTVSEWYEVNSSIEEYATDDNQGSKTASLANSAASWYFSTHTSDNRRNYDSDGDGYIDGLVIIYGAPDCYSNGVSSSYRNYTNLWAYCAWVGSSSSTSNPNVKPFFWASYDFMYGVSTAVSRTGKLHYKGNTNYCILDSHTYIHETGHILGLEDYYDYSKQYSSIGGFTMQDNNVGGHDPFSVMALGWSSPYIPTDTCKIKIKPFQESKDLILLSPSFNSVRSVFDEYLLIELYSPTGLNTFDTEHRYRPYGEGLYPVGYDGVGVRVWHVDARLIRKVSGQWQTTFYNDLTQVGNNYSTAFTNTFSFSDRSISVVDHLSYLVKESDRRYENFDLLHLIRRSNDVSYRVNRQFSGSDLFFEGDTFSMDDYASQFAYKSIFGGSKNVLDSGIDLNWSFKVNKIESDGAIIELTRLS